MMENFEEIPPVLPPKTAPRMQTALRPFYISSNNAITKDEEMSSASAIKPVNIAVVNATPSILDQIPSSLQSNGKTASSNCYGTTVFVQSKEELNQVQDHQSPKSGGHVVTIRINPNNEDKQYSTIELIQNYESKSIQKGANKSIVNLTMKNQEQVQVTHKAEPYFFYTGYQGSNGDTQIMSSGQCSPSDTLDSGTCSDLDSTPPPLPKKKNFKNAVRSSVLLNSVGTDSSSEETESNVSCDSLTELNQLIINTNNLKFPINLLQDIRERGTCLKLTEAVNPNFTEPEKTVEAVNPSVLVNESTYEDRKLQEKLLSEKSNNVSENKYLYDTDRFYTFHLNENFIENVGDAKVNEDSVDGNVSSVVSESDESFAGYKDILSGSEKSSTIRSAKGTVRGVKNRVRAGIATFLQIQQCPNKSYREKDAGRVVIYSTTMGIVRETYQQCLKVKKILRTHMVKFEERDVFMSNEYQCEIRDRMQSDQILIPQVYVDGQYIGDAETIERLNESGELRRILKPYKSADACSTCQICGGYRLLPCPVCNGSKKSVHRNHFTAEFVALKCMNCDEVGLVRCYAC